MSLSSPSSLEISSTKARESQVSKTLAEVAIAVPLDRTFTYFIPEAWKDSVKVGQRVLVPFGSRKLTGHIISLRTGSQEPTLAMKAITEVLDPEPLFNPTMLEFLNWVAKYYHASLGEVLRTATPAGISLKSMRLVTLTEKGQQFFDPQMVDSPEERVLKSLDEKGGSRISRLKKIDGVSEALLKRLEKRGLIAIDSRLEKVRIKVLKKRFVRLPVEVERTSTSEIRGKKQKEILAFLEKAGEIPLAVLEKNLKGSRSIVNRLAEMGLVLVEMREEFRDPLAEFSWDENAEPEPLDLTSDQNIVLDQIYGSLATGKFSTFLLHGVTGSGKTEVYIRAAKRALEGQREVLVLVPEISLTTQMVQRFREIFGDQIALMHSHLSDGERYDQWRRILKGDLKIVIGARSAVFAPFPNLGLVIVDEEHESSYKQEKGVFYNGRDVALSRARFAKAVAILGSATPSVETFYKSETKKFILAELPERVGSRPLPEVKIIDMTQATWVKRAGKERERPVFSQDLREAIGRCLDRKEQVLLLLNRRGYAPVLICSACGESLQCSHCAITLTFYQQTKSLRCHYCDHTEPPRDTCPKCNQVSLTQLGFGTESVEEELGTHFPQARIIRMDRDTMTKKGSHRRVIEKMQKGEVDILLGTQMVAKGLHFPRVTLVGVISADVALHMPDFRAGERTFQLLTQVAGRAGREDLRGEVLIQTYNPEHYSLVCAQTHDFHAFYRQEIDQRRDLSYPPFSRLICLRISSSNQDEGEKAVALLRDRAMQVLAAKEEYRELIRILGPSPAPISRLRGQYRWQILFKSTQPEILHRYVYQLRKWLSQEQIFKAVRLQVDVDPGNLL